MMWGSEAERAIRMAQCAELFDPDRRLPDAVHRLDLASLPLFDGDHIYFELGWQLISSIARLHSDDEIHLLILEPEVDYYANSTGTYGGFTVSTSSASSEFYELMFGKQGDDQRGVPAVTADVVAIFGDSLRWGLWCERDLAGVVAIESQASFDELRSELDIFMTPAEALQEVPGVKQIFGNRQMAQMLEQNYGGLS